MLSSPCLTALLSIGPKPTPAHMSTVLMMAIVTWLLGGVTRMTIIFEPAMMRPCVVPAKNWQLRIITRRCV